MKKLFESYVYVKLCWGRSLSHLNIPISVVDKVMLAAILLEVYDWRGASIVVTGAGIILVLLMLYVGHLDLKHGLASMENDLANRYNPQITFLVENATKKK